jgi:hypothetical protein
VSKHVVVGGASVIRSVPSALRDDPAGDVEEELEGLSPRASTRLASALERDHDPFKSVPLSDGRRIAANASSARKNSAWASDLTGVPHS